MAQRVKSLFSRIVVSALTLLWLVPGIVQAQMPPDNGTTPNSAGQIAVSPTALYSTASPMAKLSLNLTLNSFWAFAPFTGEYLEISSPNSNTMMVNIASSCTRTVGRMLACNVNFPLSTASMAGSYALVTTRYYAHKLIPTEVGYLKSVISVSGQAGSTGASSTGGPPPLPTMSAIPPHNTVGASTAVNISSTNTPSTYSTASPPIKVDFTILGAWNSNWSAPSNELLELASSTGATTPVPVASACTRSGPSNTTLTCSAYYSLSTAQLAAQNTQISVRYLANGYVGTNAFQLYSQNYNTLVQQPVVTTGGGSTSGPLCTTQSAPMMPTSIDPNGGFVFSIPTGNLCAGVFWIDPPVASAYTYTISGAMFASVVAPDVTSVPDRDGFLVSVAAARAVKSQRIATGAVLDFPRPVRQFTISDIDPRLGLLVNNPMAFPTGLELTNVTGTTVTITQTPRP
jgi:hypothetical protein